MAFRGDSTATYTYASGSTGGTVDMGARNNYRYVNAGNVYNKGKSDGVTVHTGTYNATTRSNSTGIDLTASHTYRYIRTDNVPNSNSGTYTFATNDTGGTKDLGTTNTYRYVNATNVYNKGKSDGNGLLKSIIPEGKMLLTYPAANFSWRDIPALNETISHSDHYGVWVIPVKNMPSKFINVHNICVAGIKNGVYTLIIDYTGANYYKADFSNYDFGLVSGHGSGHWFFTT